MALTGAEPAQTSGRSSSSVGPRRAQRSASGVEGVASSSSSLDIRRTLGTSSCSMAFRASCLETLRTLSTALGTAPVGLGEDGGEGNEGASLIDQRSGV